MPISIDIKELIQESYFISEEMISVDLDKFESGECSKLIITGLMGSGKTTLGKQLAAKYNCPVIDTDDIMDKFFENNRQESNKNLTRKDQTRMRNNLLLKLLDNPEKQIISGVSFSLMYGLNAFLNPEPDHRIEILLTLPFIFLGKSALKGGIAATKRDISLNKGLSKLLSIFITPLIYVPGNITLHNMMSKLKNDRIAIKGSSIKLFKI